MIRLAAAGARLLGGGVPAVIAMQFELAEDAAVELARVFYAELAAGTPVDSALAEARLHLFGRYPTRLDWAILVLFLRAENGALSRCRPSLQLLPRHRLCRHPRRLWTQPCCGRQSWSGSASSSASGIWR